MCRGCGYIYTVGPEYVNNDNNVNNVNNEGRGAAHVPPCHRHKALIYAESEVWAYSGY